MKAEKNIREKNFNNQKKKALVIFPPFFLIVVACEKKNEMAVNERRGEERGEKNTKSMQ